MFAKRFAVALAAALTTTTLPVAAHAADQCPEQPVLAGEWAGWAQIGSTKAMRYYSANGMKQWPALRALRTGTALHPIANVQYWVMPDEPIKLGTFGGMVPVRVAKAGRLKVALSDGAWVDMVRDGASTGSKAFAHGPQCSGIAKIVEFDVTPGDYLLQIANAPNMSIGVMVLQP